MNILFVWCILLALGVPIELITRPVSEDVEVWFGIEFMGWSAKVGGLAARAHFRRRNLGLLENAALDVALGRALCRPGRPEPSGLE